MKLKIKQTRQNILFLILGRLIACGVLYGGAIAFIFWSLQQITVYR